MFHNIAQNSDEWLALRIGKVTGSSISKIMATPSDLKVLLVGKDLYRISNMNTKRLLAKTYGNKVEADKALTGIKKKDITKAFGEPAKQYAIDIAVARLTGKVSTNNYTNAHMERGHEQEPLAREKYELENFCDVANGGFFDNGNTGCSPDGLVSDNGLIEIKSVIPSVHYKRFKSGGFDAAYKWQLMFNLKETERDWIDFVSFCLDFPLNKRLYTHRILATDCTNEFEQIDSRLKEFELLINQITTDIS